MKKLSLVLLVSLLLVAFAVPVTALAEPAPFGLQIGSATSAEVLAKYSGTLLGLNKYSDGKMFELDTKGFDFDGLKKVVVIFSKDDRLLALLANLPKAKFKSLKTSLDGKYKVVNAQTPFVGDQNVIYLDGTTEIEIDAPHLGFAMSLNYISKDFVLTFETRKVQERQETLGREASQL